MPLFRRKSEKKAGHAPLSSPHESRRGSTSKIVPIQSSRTSTQLPNGSGVNDGADKVQLTNEVRGSGHPRIGGSQRVTSDEAGSKHPKPVGFQRITSDEETKYGDLGSGTTTRKNEVLAQSRLSRTLNEVLNDNGALPYFIHFMDSKKVGQLVRFWLAVESFSRASWSRLRTESINILKSSLANSSASSTTPTNCVANQERNCIDIPSLLNEKVNNNSETHIDTTLPVAVQAIARCEKTHARSKSDTVLGLALANSSGKKEEVRAQDTNSIQQCKSKFQDPRTPIERDAMNIYTTYICKDAPHPIGVSEEIRLEVIAKICPENDQPDANSFCVAHNYVYDSLEKKYFPEFMNSEFHAKYQVDILTSGKVYLADILFNDTAMFHFMEYMEQEKCLNSLQFYLAADNFQQQLLTQEGQYDGMEAQSDAMVLYDKYFSLQATDPLGFSDTVRLEVESNICREEGPLPDCFATAKQQALMTIEAVHFPGFLTSDLYYMFLSELVNQIKSEIKIPASDGSLHPSQASGISHTSSDQASNKNTLLAEGKVKSLFEMNDFSIDSGDLNPNSLWSRPNQPPMSFGTVNALGQFVAEYEPDPEVVQHKAKGKFSLRKLVNKEDKTKEEMAWKVAQMIIKDVNMQTQNTAVGFPPSQGS